MQNKDNLKSSKIAKSWNLDCEHMFKYKADCFKESYINTVAHPLKDKNENKENGLELGDIVTMTLLIQNTATDNIINFLAFHCVTKQCSSDSKTHKGLDLQYQVCSKSHI
ncbi:unnamed protein product [Moneuplotes crassus]|uniref:Uncharacterized protein n=1 Tax=Euplotes crassus TaxID=5936 RepID=A0AAD1YBK1_EUPCR|nr:unnamed protein product [Moneuplotes crassus]